MTTPEGKVKREVTALLKSYDDIYWWMPVPGGYGESTLDYIGCFAGEFFAIETKAPGNKPTERQRQIINRIGLAGGTVFVISDASGLEDLYRWLETKR